MLQCHGSISSSRARPWRVDGRAVGPSSLDYLLACCIELIEDPARDLTTSASISLQISPLLSIRRRVRVNMTVAVFMPPTAVSFQHLESSATIWVVASQLALKACLLTTLILSLIN